MYTVCAFLTAFTSYYLCQAFAKGVVYSSIVIPEKIRAVSLVECPNLATCHALQVQLLRLIYGSWSVTALLGTYWSRHDLFVEKDITYCFRTQGNHQFYSLRFSVNVGRSVVLEDSHSY